MRHAPAIVFADLLSVTPPSCSSEKHVPDHVFSSFGYEVTQRACSVVVAFFFACPSLASCFDFVRRGVEFSHGADEFFSFLLSCLSPTCFSRYSSLFSSSLGVIDSIHSFFSILKWKKISPVQPSMTDFLCYMVPIRILPGWHLSLLSNDDLDELGKPPIMNDTVSNQLKKTSFSLILEACHCCLLTPCFLSFSSLFYFTTSTATKRTSSTIATAVAIRRASTYVKLLLLLFFYSVSSLILESFSSFYVISMWIPQKRAIERATKQANKQASKKWSELS